MAMVAIVAAAMGCGIREPVPAFVANDARFGRLRGSDEAPSRQRMCSRWTSTVVTRDEHASTHVSFPETDAQAACFTPVKHDGRAVTVPATPSGCAYPDRRARAKLEALASELDALDDTTPHPLFACALAPDVRAATRRQNARALRAAARSKVTYPYAAVLVPGHGVVEQNDTVLAGYRPADACRALADGDLGRLGAMPIRAARAADALNGGVAPLAIVSGAAVHSRVIEAFALMQLLECREHIDPERILLEPCADHTHTNLRNGARWLDAMGARSAYLLTDDFIQSEYFQDFSGFEFLLGSIDQRSMRDWGYVIGSWRQASSGNDAGFWFTPYRFWAEPRDGLGSVTCAGFTR